MIASASSMLVVAILTGCASGPAAKDGGIGAAVDDTAVTALYRDRGGG